MNYKMLLLFLVVFSSQLNANNCLPDLNLAGIAKADSLYNLSKKADQNCAIKLLDSAAYYFIQEGAFSKASKCYISAGINYRAQGEPDEAIQTFKKAIQKAEEASDPDVEYRAKYLLGVMYSETYQSELALALLEPMRHSKPETENPITLKTHALIYNVLGNEYVIQRKYGKAIEHYKMGAQHCRELGYKNLEVVFLNGLGIVCSNVYDDDGALDYYQEALEVMEPQDQMWGIINNNIAGIKLKRKAYPSARKYYSSVLENPHATRFDSCVASIALGKLYLKSEEFRDLDLSKKLLDAGFSIAKEFQNKHQLIIGNLYLGEYFTSIENHQTAQQHFKDGLDLIGDEKEFIAEKVEIEYAELISFLKASNQNHLAQKLTSLYENVDSSTATEILQVVAGERVKYDTEKKEQEIVLLEKESALAKVEATRNKAIGATVALFLVLISVIVYFLYDRERKNKNVAEEKKEMLEKIRQAENHTVDNNYLLILNNLEEQEMITKNKETQVALQKTKSLVHASSVVYNTIRAVEDDQGKASQNFCHGFIDLCDKLSALANKIRPTKVHIHCDPSLQVSKRAIRPLFLAVEELFTNSVKHAFHDQEAPEIKISLKKIGDHSLQLSYSDNGPGIQKTQNISLVKPTDFEILNSLISKLRGKTSIESLKGLSFKFNFDYQTLTLL